MNTKLAPTAQAPQLCVLGEALMDCIAQPEGSLLPHAGGSPYNLARAAARRGAVVRYLNPLSSDLFGDQLAQQLAADGVLLADSRSPLPTSLAVVQLQGGSPHYSFYRESIADRDYQVEALLAQLATMAPGILHTGSLFLVPPEHERAVQVMRGARALGWTISLDINLRPSVCPDLARYRPAVLAAIAEADWLKASDEDLLTLGQPHTRLDNAHAAVQSLRALAPPGRLQRVALTFGAAGAHLDIGVQGLGLAAPPVQVVDTVGAGDTFWGNCLAGWALQSGPPDLAASLGWALRAAAFNCARAGCQPPHWDELQAAQA